MLNISGATLGLLIMCCGEIFLYHNPAVAAAPRERITLMLTGSNCREAQHSFEVALRQTDGIVAVDGSSVPQHLLIDVEGGKTSLHDILRIVHTSTNVSLACQIEVMQSCITAPRLTRPDLPVN